MITSSCPRRRNILLFSTTAPSSKISETLPDDDDSDQADHKEMSKNTKPSTVSAAMMESGGKDGVQNHEFLDHTKQRTVITPLAMPWSEVQDWALRDNLPKYTIMVPLESSNNIASRPEGNTLVFALWRTMLNEVPELAGYPIDFLQEVHAQQVSHNETRMLVTPQLLPYLEDYSFAAAGGVSGKVYGVPGLADGTRIETSAVSNIEITLSQGFVRTSDGKAAYELGRPQQDDLSQPSSNNLLRAKSVLGSATVGSYELLRNVNVATPEVLDDADGMLLRLGASTGILLAGATAINLLSHHLTVNVFWV